MQAKLCKDMQSPDGPKPAGTIIDHPHAYLLVRMGCADPHDEECTIKAAMSPEQLAAAKKAQVRTAAGIHPDDFAAFDAGRMIGYDPATGKPIPGPNAIKRANRRARAQRRRNTTRK